MIKEAITKIQELVEAAQNEILKEINGLQYQLHGRDGYRLMPPPQPKLLPTHTLDGLLSWFDSPEGPPEKAHGGYFIQVEDHIDVNLFLKKGEYEDRNTIMNAHFEEPRFPYGQYLEVKDFIIKVQTLFEKNATQKSIIDFASKVKTEHVKTSEDSGVAQRVTVVDDVGRLEEKEMDPMIQLQPKRTFTEAAQPGSMFLLRMEKRDDKTVFALFEADAGAWKVQAVKNVVEYLRNHEIVKARQIKVVG